MGFSKVHFEHKMIQINLFGAICRKPHDPRWCMFGLPDCTDLANVNHDREDQHPMSRIWKITLVVSALLFMAGCSGPAPAPTSGPTATPISEREALMAMYEETGGQNWIEQDFWLSKHPVCIWDGIKCENDHVTKIHLGSNNLQGKLPPEIGQLTRLSVLDLEW